MFGLGIKKTVEKTPPELVLEKVAQQSFPLVFKVFYHDELKELYGSGKINDGELEAALEMAVNIQGKREYNRVVAGQQYADHLGGNEAMLVHAIENGTIPPRKSARMPIVHGESLLDYCDEFRNPQLLVELRETLLDPKPLFAGYDLSDICTCCCDDLH